MPPSRVAVHIFRRDLRLVDNSALMRAADEDMLVIPAFIYDRRQVEHNQYASPCALRFLFHSLAELDVALQAHGGRLYRFFGTAEECVRALIDALPIARVTVNRDYTPFARQRDLRIAEICADAGIEYIAMPDTLLTEPEAVHKRNGAPYTIFTYFHRFAQQIAVYPPASSVPQRWYTAPISGEVHADIERRFISSDTSACHAHGGRQEGLNLLRRLPTLQEYDTLRDIPAAEQTSRLSAHIKFGTLSIREIYAVARAHFSPDGAFIAQLYWRDFFTHIAYHFPHVFGASFHRRFSALQWNTDRIAFDRWCAGRTGFPIVDAGMRELTTYGYMHNRVRMITASFLIKDLYIDWQQGEHFFARHLTDYDPSVNNGSWQWVASTGCDAAPYFRIFNPWRQQKLYDTECRYIKRLLPELQSLPARAIHNLEHGEVPAGIDYPPPMLSHQQAALATKERYAACR